MLYTRSFRLWRILFVIRGGRWRHHSADIIIPRWRHSFAAASDWGWGEWRRWRHNCNLRVQWLRLAQSNFRFLVLFLLTGVFLERSVDWAAVVHLQVSVHLFVFFLFSQSFYCFIYFILFQFLFYEKNKLKLYFLKVNFFHFWK